MTVFNGDDPACPETPPDYIPSKTSVPSFVGRLYADEHVGPGGLAGTWVRRAEVDALLDELTRQRHAFKNFHRMLCERFEYGHDEVDWERDQVSLMEWIAKRGSHETSEQRGAGEPETAEKANIPATQESGLLATRLRRQIDGAALPSREVSVERDWLETVRDTLSAVLERQQIANTQKANEPRDWVIVCGHSWLGRNGKFVTDERDARGFPSCADAQARASGMRCPWSVRERTPTPSNGDVQP